MIQTIFLFVKYLSIECTGYIPDYKNNTALPILGKIFSPEHIGMPTTTKIESIFCATDYGESGVHLKNWKYYKSKDAKENIIKTIEILSIQYTEYFKDFDYIIPYPLGIDRYIFRGFNQSNILAQSLSQELKIVKFSYVFRFISGRHQSRLSKMSRIKRKFYFFCFLKKRLIGKKVLVVDDVISTGSSINSFAEFLHSQGVSGISLFVLARNNEPTLNNSK